MRPDADPATVELLLAVHPLLRFCRGEKREFLQRAWIAAALCEARTIVKDERELPASPQGALIALHAAVLALGEAMGVSRIEFMEAFNSRADARGNAKLSPEDAIEHARGLFLTLLARRLEAA